MGFGRVVKNHLIHSRFLGFNWFRGRALARFNHAFGFSLQLELFWL